MSYPGADEIAVKKATVTLTDAQIKALPTTGVTIVPAPGDNKLLVPVAALLRSARVADYTGIGDGTLGLVYGSGASHTAMAMARNVSGILGDLDGALNSGAASTCLLGYKARGIIDALPAEGQAASTDVMMVSIEGTNEPLKLRANHSGDFTGGDPANTLRCTVLYMVVNV